MKRFKTIKLGTVCVDKATRLQGTVTHCAINMGGKVSYFFQPKGLDENGQPVRKLFLELERLEMQALRDFENIEVPFEVLGSIVTSKCSGFTGMATEFIRHINGCFHVVIQPEGMNVKTGLPIQKCDFDLLRDCVGDKVPVLSVPEIAQSKVDKPSPEGCDSDRDALLNASQASLE